MIDVLEQIEPLLVFEDPDDFSLDSNTFDGSSIDLKIIKE